MDRNKKINIICCSLLLFTVMILLVGCDENARENTNNNEFCISNYNHDILINHYKKDYVQNETITDKENMSTKKPESSNQEIKEGQWEKYTMTHYTAKDEGCSGITRSEIDVRNITEYEGYKIIAVDKSVIELGSIVIIKDNEETYEAIALDTGGAIKGRKLDLLVGSKSEAKQLGKKTVKLKVVREGWQKEKL